MAELLTTSSPESFNSAVVRAATMLRAGEVVALPTETVYGLAANALDASAVEKIFTAKGRPSHNPIIVHVSSVAMARQCAAEWPERAEQLARAFWPGPLTMVLPKAHTIPDIVTAGGRTVGLRWPRHPVMQAVIEACGFPLAAPSANSSGQVSPTTAAHVERSLGQCLPLIVDGGSAEVGIESTVIDLTVTPARILRPGMVHAESLRAVLGHLGGKGETAGVLRSPGLLLKHYAPKAKLVIWRPEEALNKLGVAWETAFWLVRESIPGQANSGRLSLMPREPETYARALYGELHRLDEAGAALIVVEAVPDTPEWQAIADRLRRAAA